MDKIKQQHARGVDDALVGNAFGHQNEANSYPAQEAELDAAYRAGWAEGREKKHPSKPKLQHPFTLTPGKD